MALRREGIRVEEEALKAPRGHQRPEKNRDNARLVCGNPTELSIDDALTRLEVREKDLHGVAVIPLREPGLAVGVDELRGSRIPDPSAVRGEAYVRDSFLQPGGYRKE